MLYRLLLLALLALALAHTPVMMALGLSALPLAILLGIAYGNLAPQVERPGDGTVMAFCQQKLLRLGIILFGFNLSFQQIAAVGYQAIVLDAIVIAVILTTGIAIGIHGFKLSREVAVLTAVGSAVCGVAAIMATESVIKAREQDTAVSVATVILFGTLAMFAYPVIFHLVEMTPALFGIYIGSTVHEVAQAAAAGQFIGGEAMQNAVVVKLIRVMLLAPVVITIGSLFFRGQQRATTRLPVPWFVLGFVGCAALNSLLTLPAPLLQGLQLASQLSLAVAMVALGLKTRWHTVRQAGIKPMALSFLLFIMLLAGGFGLNLLICH